MISSPPACNVHRWTHPWLFVYAKPPPPPPCRPHRSALMIPKCRPSLWIFLSAPSPFFVSFSDFLTGALNSFMGTFGDLLVSLTQPSRKGSVTEVRTLNPPALFVFTRHRIFLWPPLPPPPTPRPPPPPPPPHMSMMLGEQLCLAATKWFVSRSTGATRLHVSKGLVTEGQQGADEKLRFWWRVWDTFGATRQDCLRLTNRELQRGVFVDWPRSRSRRRVNLVDCWCETDCKVSPRAWLFAFQCCSWYHIIQQQQSKHNTKGPEIDIVNHENRSAEGL